MSGPLEGCFVVDRTWGLPGSIAGMLLADYGATVVKVERPGRPSAGERALRRVFERGKASVTTAGETDVDTLLASADVLLSAGGPPHLDAGSAARVAHHTSTPGRRRGWLPGTPTSCTA